MWILIGIAAFFIVKFLIGMTVIGLLAGFIADAVDGMAGRR